MARMDLLGYFFLLLSAAGLAGSQLLIKKGSGVLHEALKMQGGFDLVQLFKKIFAIVFEPHVFVALVINFLVMFLWLKVVSRSELSFAYPLVISLTILITTIFSILLFKETTTSFKIAGIVFIGLGLILITSGK